MFGNFGHSAWGETPLRARDSVKERMFAAIALPRPFFAIILADISITTCGISQICCLCFLFHFDKDNIENQLPKKLQKLTLYSLAHVRIVDFVLHENLTVLSGKSL